MIVRPSRPSTFRLLFTSHGSIVPEILPRALFTVFIAALVTITHGWLYHFKVTLTTTPFSLIGLTLAIFLGFRNSVSYERFWEGRKLWGELLIVTRNLARQILTLPQVLKPEERQKLFHFIVGFCHALRGQLRQQDISHVMYRLFNAEDAQRILSAPNRPNIILLMLAEHIGALTKQHRLDPILLTNMDEQVTRMSYVLGGCERIQSTPIPYAYILLLHRTVHLYCFLLPFGLVDSVGFLTPLVVGIVSYTFFSLDALGDQIEDPFGLEPNDLPLDNLCCTIETNVLSLIDLPNVSMAPQIDAKGIIT